MPSDRGVYASTDLVNPVLYANEEDNCVFTRYLNQQGKIVIPAQKGSDGQTYFVSLILHFVFKQLQQWPTKIKKPYLSKLQP